MFIKVERYNSKIEMVVNINYILDVEDEKLYTTEDRKPVSIIRIYSYENSFLIIGSAKQIRAKIHKAFNRMMYPQYIYDGDKKTIKKI